MKRWLIIIALLMCFQGCGLFKKTVDKAKSKKREKVEKTENQLGSKSDNSISKTTSKTFIEFELFPPPAFDGSTPKIEWYDRIKAVTITTDKEEDIKLNIFEEFKKTSIENSDIHQNEQKTEKRVDRDSTLKANLTWWMWLIILLIILAMLYYALKKVSII